MGRHGYTDDSSTWDYIRWRGQVASSVRGKRGQEFLKELVDSLDASDLVCSCCSNEENVQNYFNEILVPLFEIEK